MSEPYRSGPRLGTDQMASIRQTMLLDGCKWDPQVGDVCTLAPFSLFLSRDAWRQLAAWAEQLTTEAVAAEAELMHRPELHKYLGISRPMRNALAMARGSPTPSAVRSVRYDFHWTRDGWRISEANPDVPGGFTESSLLPKLFESHGGQLTGDPAAMWCDALIGRIGTGSTVALLWAPGYMEDFQVVSFLAHRLRERGLRAKLCTLRQISWRDGHAFLEDDDHALGAMVRFYQAEWLGKLRRECEWTRLFGGVKTPVTNPPTTMLVESKRFPLVWDSLRSSFPTWRKLLPETRDPRHAPWRTDDAWLVKSAFCNTGDSVTIRALTQPKAWRKTAREVWWDPTNWIAQRQFESVPLDTPLGPMFPCIGVYTIDGRAAGIYGRLSPSPVIDYAAIDVPVLLDDAAIGEAHAA